MPEAIIDGVHRIANHIYKQKGYFVTIKRIDVATVLEAFVLLSNRIVKEAKDNEKTINTNTYQ